MSFNFYGGQKYMTLAKVLWEIKEMLSSPWDLQMCKGLLVRADSHLVLPICPVTVLKASPITNPRERHNSHPPCEKQEGSTFLGSWSAWLSKQENLSRLSTWWLQQATMPSSFERSLKLSWHSKYQLLNALPSLSISAFTRH